MGVTCGVHYEQTVREVDECADLPWNRLEAAAMRNTQTAWTALELHKGLRHSGHGLPPTSGKARYATAAHSTQYGALLNQNAHLTREGSTLHITKLCGISRELSKMASSSRWQSLSRCTRFSSSCSRCSLAQTHPLLAFMPRAGISHR